MDSCFLQLGPKQTLGNKLVSTANVDQGMVPRQTRLEGGGEPTATLIAAKSKRLITMRKFQMTVKVISSGKCPSTKPWLQGVGMSLGRRILSPGRRHLSPDVIARYSNPEHWESVRERILAFS